MSRGKDKSSDKVKWNMSAGCSKCEQISTERLIHKPNLGAKTYYDSSAALVLSSFALFKLTETMIIDRQRGKAATGPV